MITSNGEQVVEITGAVARAVSSNAKQYTATQYAKADIMQIINRDMNIGYDCSWWRPRIGKQLEQELCRQACALLGIDWMNPPEFPHTPEFDAENQSHYGAFYWWQ